LRYADRFDDPNLTGSMEVTISFRKVSVGTDLHIEQTGIPDAIRVEACYLGWQHVNTGQWSCRKPRVLGASRERK
jgi:hypothetical protein